jgi:hypothetical protein
MDQEKLWKISVSIDGVLAEIRTEHLSNKTLKRYRYANPLDWRAYDTELQVNGTFIMGQYVWNSEFADKSVSDNVLK